MNTFFDTLTNIVQGSVLENEPMAKHTNFRIGGPARYFVEVKTIEELQKTIDLAKEHAIPWVVLGGGSNILVADEGYRGLVVKIGFRQLDILTDQGGSPTGAVVADAGVLSVMMARKTAMAGLKGFGWAIGLPGTIGGAVRGNAGCFGGETRDYLTKVEVFRDGDVIELSNEECTFAYRESVFKHNQDIVLRAHFELETGDATELTKELDDFLSKRKSTQPLYAGSAGCLFKNTDVNEPIMESLGQMFQIPDPMRTRYRIGSGWLIDQLGLKGVQEGRAQISPEHANFVVNLGDATAHDIASLITRIKKDVLEKTGIHLEEEVQLVGFE